VDAVPPRASAHINHRVAGAGGLGVKDIFLAAHPQGENIDQRVAVVTRLEEALAAHRGHAETIAVVRDARHHAAQDAPVARSGLRIVEPPEAQRIHHRDGPRPIVKMSRRMPPTPVAAP